jgi:hypothetical protein
MSSHVLLPAMAVATLAMALGHDAAGQPRHLGSATGAREAVTFRSPLPPCEAKDVVILNAMPARPGTMRTVVCRRAYDVPVDQVLQRYRRAFEAAGYSVRADRADERVVHLNATRGASEVEVFVQRGEAGLPIVEIVHELNP